MSTSPRKPAKTYTIEQVVAALQAKGIPYKVEGRQVNADLSGSGHMHVKITPARGLFLDAATGKGGTVSALLRQIGATAPATATATATGAQAPASHPANGGNQDEDQEKKIKRARSIWANGWACSSVDEVYTGPLLAKRANARAKGAVRDRMHRARDAAFAYLMTRKLDPRWMPQLRIFLLDKSQKDDYAMGKQGAVAGLAFPMLNNGILVGIQRVFLDAAGKKISRMMLGKPGIMNIAPLDSSPIIKLPSEQQPILLWGEGWETCAHAVQASHLPCTVLYTAGQIRIRADLYLSQSATATPEQIAAMPIFGMLVDRDASNTGQKACIYAIQKLRKAGLEGLYLCPPDVVRGGEKGADWGDAGQELGERGCGVALSFAMHNQPVIPDIEEKEALDQDAATPWIDVSSEDEHEEPLLENFGISTRRPRVQNWRKSTQPGEACHINVYNAEGGREILKTGIEQLVDEYVIWLDKYKTAKEKADDETHLGHVELPAFRPFLFKPTTGAGKSRHLKALPDNEKINLAGGAVRIFVATKSECDSFVEANPAFFRYHGRSPDPTSPGYCQNYAEMLKAVESGHIPQAEFCFNCKYGLKWSINHHGEASEQGKKSAEKLERMGISGDDLKALEPCVWQPHQRKALAHQNVVTTHHSYSENLATWHSEDGKIPALSCFDEDAPFSATVEKITQEKVDEWARRNASNIRYFRHYIENNIGDPSEFTEQLRVAEASQDTLVNFAMEIAKMTGKSGRIGEDSPLWTCINTLIDMDGTSSLAVWEHLEFERDGSLSATPLRGAYAIAQTLRVNDGFIENGGLHVSAVRPVIERLGRLPTALFNATPSPVDESIICAKNGVVIDVVVQQHAHITRRTNRFYGLKGLKMGGTDPKRLRREVARYEKMIEYFSRRKFIFHKAARDYLDPENTVEKLGHWGADHRAHNRFAGEDLVIAGSFFIPQQAVRHTYQAHRLAALTGGASPGEWPQMQDYTPVIDKETGKEVDDAFESGCWINEGNGVEVRCMVPLPRQPQIRAWFLRLATIETVQAIGRARAVNPTSHGGPVHIDIFGGVPLYGLAEYGLAVDEYADDPEELGMTQAEYAAEQHEAVMTDLTAAALEAVAEGQTIARDSLSERVRANRTESAKAVDNAHDMDEAGVCTGSVLDTITYPVQTPPAAAGLHPEVYKRWLEESGMPIFAMLMSVNGRAAAAVRAAQQAIIGQRQHDADRLFADLERWGQSVVDDGIDIDAAIMNDVDSAGDNAEIARFVSTTIMQEDVDAASILNPHHPDHEHAPDWLADHNAEIQI